MTVLTKEFWWWRPRRSLAYFRWQ